MSRKISIQMVALFDAADARDAFRNSLVVRDAAAPDSALVLNRAKGVRSRESVAVQLGDPLQQPDALQRRQCFERRRT